ncbi:MAG TPA: DNA recombination protein RmuC [Candidatus Saccharimonadales bacterium]|nr:DNA recombination protein RmuC [Candidatus Saccharimonadales bacterium]
MAVIILGVAVAVLVVLLLRRNTAPSSGDAALLLKQDLTTLTESVTQLKEGLHLQINDRLDKNNTQMLKQFAQSTDIIKDVTQKLTALEKTNQQVGDIAGELKLLQNVLQNPKQRGNLGEIYLESVLENVLPPGIFQMQYGFKNGETVDAVVFVDKKVIPIDSKFSLENYNRLVESKTPEERLLHGSEFKKDLKKRIDETAKYIRPREKTMDFAFMFIPSEAIYYDLLINKIGMANTSSRDLIEYAFRDKKVIIVSPTTLLAYLQTVLQGLRGMQIEEQAKDIQMRVGELGRHIAGYDQYMQKLGGSLGTTVNHYNAAHKELKKIDKDVVKIAGESPGVEPLLLDRPTDDTEDL